MSNESMNKYPSTTTCDDCGAVQGVNIDEEDFNYNGMKLKMIYGCVWTHDCIATITSNEGKEKHYGRGKD